MRWGTWALLSAPAQGLKDLLLLLIVDFRVDDDPDGIRIRAAADQSVVGGPTHNSIFAEESAEDERVWAGDPAGVPIGDIPHGIPPDGH